jgi:CubicO group peptidase (beta-lactamase class C family)
MTNQEPLTHSLPDDGDASNHVDPRLVDAWKIVVSGAETGAYGGAVALVSCGEEVLLHAATGWAVREPEADRTPATLETAFDLASVTKVVATLPVVLMLIDRGTFGLDDPIGHVLPEFGVEGARREVTVRRLLSHTSGLPAWLPVYIDVTGPGGYLEVISRTDLTHAPGTEVVYSDLGIILLGEAVRRVTGDDIATAATREVFGPLGMVDTGYTPPASWLPRIAATEYGNPREIEMAGERAAEFAGWRAEMIRGEVHDGNAHYGLGGVAAHAGLYGTAADLARYGRLWLNRGAWEGRRLISEALVEEATRIQAPGRGLGWRVRPTDPEALGDDPARSLSPAAFGHTGFTGTSLWLDPARGLTVVLLTNRVHPRSREEIAAIRPAFHDAVAGAVPVSDQSATPSWLRPGSSAPGDRGNSVTCSRGGR